MRIDKLASSGALEFIAANSPAALPSTAATAAIAAIAAAGAAVMFVYRLYEQYAAEKHAKEITLIEQLHQEYLAKISIHECNLVAGFPPIFQKNEDGTCKTMAMTDAQVNSIARNALRAPTDIDLVSYRHHIICAIAALKKYYFMHDDKSSLTVQVILYLLNILEKLLQFEGYAFDIAYLNALCNFICTYASSSGEQSAHFTCLNPVFRHLQYATQKLIHHREMRSQEEMIAELRGTCMYYIDRAIRGLAKFSIPSSEWHLIDCCDPYPLREGVYAAEYISRIAGPLRWTHTQHTLPCDSALTTMIGKLSRYYLQTLNSTKQPAILSHAECNIRSLPQTVLENMHQIFEAHPDKNSAQPVEHLHTQQLIATLTLFAKLIHSMISFLYFLNELTKMIKNLGTSEMDNPAHCRRLYALHQTLSDHIESQADTVHQLLREINKRNDNQMRIAEKECFLRELMQMLNEIKVNVNTQSNVIHERRKAFNKKHAEDISDGTPREHMTEVVNQIEAACNITLSGTFSATPLSAQSGGAQQIRLIPPLPRINQRPSASPHPSTPMTPPRVPAAPERLMARTAETPRAALIAHHSTTAFPASYQAIYENAKRKSQHHNLPLLHLMIDMMNDYTKHNSRASRVLHGSFFHHHLDTASTFSMNLSREIRELANNTDAATQILLLAQLRNLSDSIQAPGINQTGSYAMRVKFIIEKCAENGVVLHDAERRAAV